MNKTPKRNYRYLWWKYNQIYYYKNTLECLFKSYWGIGLETPVFEIKENKIILKDLMNNNQKSL